MANNNRNKGDKATRVTQVIVGTRKHFPNGNEAITLDGTPTTINGAVDELQAFVDGRAKIVATQATEKQLVAAEKAGMPALDAFLNAFTTFIKAQLGPDSGALADFGIPVLRKRAPRTAEEKAVAAAKAKATRAAHEKAKKVAGNVTAQLVVTPAPPADGTAATAAPAAPPAPVPTTAPKA